MRIIKLTSYCNCQAGCPHTENGPQHKTVITSFLPFQSTDGILTFCWAHSCTKQTIFPSLPCSSVISCDWVLGYGMEAEGLDGTHSPIQKEISSEYSLEGLMPKLKLQYFGDLMRRTDSLEKTLMLEKIEGRKRRGQQRMRWLDGITDRWKWVWASSRSWRAVPCPSLACCGLWGRKELDTTERLKWTHLKMAPKNLPLLLPFPVSCWEKKRSKRQRRKIYPTECRVPKTRRKR